MSKFSHGVWQQSAVITCKDTLPKTQLHNTKYMCVAIGNNKENQRNTHNAQSLIMGYLSKYHN